MSHSLSDSQWLGIAKFLVIGIAVPVAYVLLVVVRRNLYGPRLDNWFCGLDLSLGTLVAIGSWILEPLPVMTPWLTETFMIMEWVWRWWSI